MGKRIEAEPEGVIEQAGEPAADGEALAREERSKVEARTIRAEVGMRPEEVEALAREVLPAETLKAVREELGGAFRWVVAYEPPVEDGEAAVEEVPEPEEGEPERD